MKLRWLAVAGVLVVLIFLTWLSFGDTGFGFAVIAPMSTARGEQARSLTSQACAAASCTLAALPEPASIVIPPDALPSDAGYLAWSLAQGYGAQAGLDGPPPDLTALNAAATANDECTSQRLAALEQMVRSRIELAFMPAEAVTAGPGPTIHYHLPFPTSSPAGESYIFGVAAPETAVDMRLVREGSEIASAHTTSDANGAYHIYPDISPCADWRTEQALAAGDVIEISAGGMTANTVAVPLSVWMDPVANQIAGRTTGETTISAAVSQPHAADRCASASYQRTTQTVADGTFSIDWNGVIDFDNSANSTVCAIDASGNGPCFFAQAFHLVVKDAEPDSVEVECQVKPGAAFEIEVSRNGAGVQRVSGSASLTGRCSATLSPVQVGDVIRLTSAGVDTHHTLHALTAALEYDKDRVTGTTVPGAAIVARFRERGYTYAADRFTSQTSCGSASSCRSSQADTAGAFSIGAGMDIVRGDYVFVSQYDAVGNRHDSRLTSAPAIIVNQLDGLVSGYWPSVIDSELRIRVLNGNYVEKATGSANVRLADGAFYNGFGGNTIASGDKVEVRASTGQHVETMTVQPWDVRFDDDTKHLSGSSLNGFVAGVRETGCGGGYYLSDPPQHCQQSSTPGTFDLSFEGSELAGLFAEVALRGPDGHYTKGVASPFHVNMWMNYYFFWVGVETADSTATSVLRRNGSTWPLYCSRGGGGYQCSASESAFLNLPLPGDIVDVTTSDGDAVSLEIPVFTVQGSNAPGVYGKAPPEAPVRTTVNGYIRYPENEGYAASWTERLSVSVQADSSGRYFASYAGLVAQPYESTSVCPPVRPDSPCAVVSANYCTPAGHGFNVQYTPSGHSDDWVPADAFEEDDTPESATAYTGPQHHTFDWESDADWVRFDVPESAVADGVTYRFETYNLAYGAIHDVALFDAADVLLLQWRVESTDAASTTRTWQPAEAGAYYLRVERPGVLGDLGCFDVYDLRIWAGEPWPIYLPTIVR